MGKCPGREASGGARVRASDVRSLESASPSEHQCLTKVRPCGSPRWDGAWGDPRGRRDGARERDRAKLRNRIGSAWRHAGAMTRSGYRNGSGPFTCAGSPKLVVLTPMRLATEIHRSFTLHGRWSKSPPAWITRPISISTWLPPTIT